MHAGISTSIPHPSTHRLGGDDFNGWASTDLYYSASWQVLEERQGVTTSLGASASSNGFAAARYLFSPVYVNAPIVRERDADHDGSHTLEERLVFTCDANFNITGVLNAGGSVQQRLLYQAYGEMIITGSDWQGQLANTLALRQGFQGGWQDLNTGLINFQMRDYNPRTMTWNTQDPLGYVDGTNFYQFIKGNPNNGTDPSGLFASFKNLNCCQIDLLKADEKAAKQAIVQLQADIRTAIVQVNNNKRDYPAFTDFKLRHSIEILDKASKSFDRVAAVGHGYKSTQSGRGATAIPVFNILNIWNHYFYMNDRARTALLIHEMTHIGSLTNDIRYFNQNGEMPHDVGIIGWDIIADTYQTWLEHGFQIPGFSVIYVTKFDENGSTPCSTKY